MDGSLPNDTFAAPIAVPIPTLAAEITELAGHLNAGAYRFLKLIAEFDHRKGWSDSATQSCAHWLNWKCGIDMGAAREKVRTAHALESLPKIAAAMSRGELSYAKARALTRVACASTEDYFLSIALHGTAHHVETLVRHYRRAKEAEELSRDAQQQANRYVRYQWDDDGSIVIKARLPAEAGALLIKALEAAAQDLPVQIDPAPPGKPVSDVPAETSTIHLQPPDVSAETSTVKSRSPGASAKTSIIEASLPASVSAETPTVKLPPAMRRADALTLMAESYLAHGAKPLSGGDKHQIVIHIDHETLTTSTAGRCELDDGPALAAETARRLACDASRVILIENAKGELLNIGRKTRSIPPAIQRALNARDQGCRFPGCCNKRFVDAHHIQHWAHGGETKLSNLVTLCRFHHRAAHEGGIQILILDDGALRFLKPDGSALDSIHPGHTQPLGDWTDLPRRHHEHDIHIDPKTAVTRWGGESMDYGLAVQVLLQQSQRQKGVSAGRSA